MVSECEGGGALLGVPFCLIWSWYALGICPLLRNMVLDPVLALVAIGRLTETHWEAVEDHDWFSYNYEDGKIMLLPEEPPWVRRSVSGFEEREGGRLEIRPKYREEFTHRGMSLEYARLVWRRYYAARTDLKTIATLEEQNALTRPARPITNGATADVVVPAERAPSSPAVPEDEKDWKMDDLVVVNTYEWVQIKCRLRGLQDLIVSKS